MHSRGRPELDLHQPEVRLASHPEDNKGLIKRHGQEVLARRQDGDKALTRRVIPLRFCEDCPVAFFLWPVYDCTDRGPV